MDAGARNSGVVHRRTYAPAGCVSDLKFRSGLYVIRVRFQFVDVQTPSAKYSGCIIVDRLFRGVTLLLFRPSESQNVYLDDNTSMCYRMSVKVWYFFHSSSQ